MPGVKARYLVSKPQKGGTLHYWQPTKGLIVAGFRVRRLSDDPAEAFREAEQFNQALDAWRAGAPPVDLQRRRPDIPDDTYAAAAIEKLEDARARRLKKGAD